VEGRGDKHPLANARRGEHLQNQGNLTHARTHTTCTPCVFWWGGTAPPARNPLVGGFKSRRTVRAVRYSPTRFCLVT